MFFVGGLISYRALFNWLNPWIFFPTLVVAPIFQVLFFAFLGHAAGLESDRFYVIGNALQITALPGFFAMALTITGERYSQTLAPLLATAANRAAVFLGRALPVTANAAPPTRSRATCCSAFWRPKAGAAGPWKPFDASSVSASSRSHRHSGRPRALRQRLLLAPIGVVSTPEVPLSV